jgi:hypothetical protein
MPQVDAGIIILVLVINLFSSSSIFTKYLYCGLTYLLEDFMPPTDVQHESK